MAAPQWATIEREMRAAAGLQAAMDSGILPLDVMLARMRGETINGAPVSRDAFEAACAAAPYVHARLAAQTLRGDPDAPLAVRHSLDDINKRVRELLNKGRLHAG